MTTSLAIIAALVVTCCRGYYVNGVRRDGSTQCIKAPSGTGALECVDSGACRFTDTDPRYPIAIHCTGGSRPIVVNSDAIGCQR